MDEHTLCEVIRHVVSYDRESALSALGQLSDRELQDAYRTSIDLMNLISALQHERSHDADEGSGSLGI